MDNFQTTHHHEKPLWAWVSAIALIALLVIFNSHKAHSSEKAISVNDI